MNVLHIIKSLGRGGAERLLPETIQLHNKEIFSFHVVYFLPWKNQMVDSLLQAGATVTCLAANNNWQLLLQAKKLARYVKQHKIHIIHAHLPWAGIVARIAGKITGVPVIYTEHNKWERYNKGTFYLNKLSFPWQKTVVAVSEDVASSIKLHYHAAKPFVEVISNGINTKSFQRNQADNQIRQQLNIPETAFVVGIVSVFRFQKRLHIWLQLAEELHSKYTDMHFIIVGSGPLEKELLAQSEQLKQAAYVHFVGLQAEVKPYYNAMDAFMMTSEFEGLPIALLEAMSMKVIPICTAAGGIGEVVQHQINGWLTPVNQPEQLVAGVDWVYSLPPHARAELAAQVRRRVCENNSMETMVTQLENLYQTVQ